MHVVFGCNGPVGLETIRQLIAAGVPPEQVRGVCRSGKAEVASGVSVFAANAANAGAVRQACRDATVAYCCIGVDYTRFPELWPPIISGLLSGLNGTGVPLVFADNLYAYGPQTAPLVETMPDTNYGRKPALRARIARQMLEADAAGRVRVALVRASDFYGPGAGSGHLGDLCFQRVLRGQAALFMGALNKPHAFTYVPDFARALVTVGASSEGFGQVWHVPNAPAMTISELMLLVQDLLGRRVRALAMPFWLQSALSAFMPLMREIVEMRFQWDRPYLVDHGKFAAAFWDNATPLEQGLRATLDWYRQRMR
jgi:nucleoside-diphosphate-sugar epimerase